MSFEDKLNELYAMGGDLTLSESQRKAAMNSFNTMIDQNIRAAIERIEGRTEELNKLIEQLQAIIDSIKANDLDRIVRKANEIVAAANDAAKND